MASAPEHAMNKQESIDRFASVIDTEAPRFAKQRKEGYRHWEANIQSLCHAIQTGTHAYYDRKIEVHSEIVQAITSRRNEVWPEVSPNEVTDDIRELALAPWVFQSLPGIKPATSWPNSLPALAERLD